MGYSGLLRFSLISTLVASLATGQVMVPSGTKISARLEQTITSANADEGQQVQLSVTENVRIGDNIVIPQGAPIVGTIVLAQGKRA